MAFFDLQKTREQYLERLLARYGTVTLPIDSARLALPLHTVFQPMVLRRDPLAPQDRQSVVASEVVKARDGAEALIKSEHRRMVVLGGPGMGKTTTLKALLYTAITTVQIDPSAPLPLFISLPDLMRARLSFEEYIQQVTADLDIDPRFASILTVAVNHGNAFLCLDSLDEVLPALRPDVIAFLNKEAPRCQGTWIIGSRFTEYKGGQFAHSQFAEWELQALSEQERLALARQLLPALYDAFYSNMTQNRKPALPSAQAYVEELQQSMQIAAWGENPLLFSLAAVLYMQTGRLAASRAVLYAQVTEAMFTMRIHDAEQRAELRHLLADLALEFYQTRGRNFSITDVLELLSSLVSDQSTQSLSATLTRILDSGVLEPVAYQAYGFKHQMFQEYLAAIALARRCVDETQRQSTWDLLWRKRRLSRWNEILRLLVGILVQEHGVEGLQIAHEWLSALAREQSMSEGDPGNLCLILAMKSLGEFGERVSETEVADLVQHILEIWEKTITELFRLGGWQYAQPLREQANVLCAFSLHIVAPIILRLQQYDPHIQLFCHIPAASGVIDHSLPMNILWHLFQDQPVSFYACHIVRILQTPAIIERLVAILESTDGNWSGEDLTVVAKLLGKMGEKTPLSLLVKIWQDTTLDDDLRAGAAKALSEAEVSVPRGVFVAMLSDRISSIRCVAIQALSKYSGQTHADLLLSALQDPDPYVREKALQSLHELGVSLPIELLQTLFYDEHESVSNEAWNCLQEQGELVPLELWLDALQHEHTWVRDYALMAVEQYRDQIPVEPVLAMLSLHKRDAYRRIDVRTHCIQALGLLGDRVPLEPLLALLHHSDEHLRSHALLVLTQRHVTLPADILLPMLHHSTTGSAAAQAIAAMGADAPISSLLEMACSHSSNSAHFAIRALRLLYEHVPTEPIRELLQDEKISDSYMGTYWELIQLLQLQGVEISLEFLLPALKRCSPQNDSAPIVASLCRAGTQAPIESLLRLIHEEARKTRFYPKWIQQLFYVLYEWVSPARLTSALGNTANDQWLAVSLLGLVHDDESIQLLTAVAQDPTRDRTTRSEAMVVLSDLGVNLPLEYLLQATRWCTYEGMGYYLADTVKRLGKQTPIEQLLPLLGEDHNRLQPGVVEALVGIAEHIPLETILPLLEDNNELVRHAAIRILGAMRERVPLDVFVGRLSDPEQTLETRCAVLSALGEVGTPAAVDLLLEALENDEAEIKSYALWALKDDDRETRRGGLRAFKEQGKEIPLEPLLRLLNDPDDHVVESAIAVLGELGSLGVAVPVEPLVSLLSHEDEFIAGDAAEALCKFGERAPIDALLANMYDTDDEQVRGSIFYALSSLETRIPLEAMLTVLSDSAKTIDGWHIAFALEKMAESTPEQILTRLHDDPHPLMRRTVLQAIRTTRACEWLPLVLATLHDADGQYTAHDHTLYGTNHTIRSAVVQTLGALNACAPIEPLLQLLYTNTEEDSYNDERIVVLKALRQFGSRVPPTALWPLLGSNHTEICRLAFQHLQITHPAVLKELVPVLKAIVRGEPVQGAFAARMHYRIAETVALMGRATPAVLEMVTGLLDHPFWEVRSRAAKTLGTLRRNIPDSAIRRLLELRKDPESPDVRAAAGQALAEILSLEQGIEDE
jgi:HEAT repeat protein